MTAEVTISGGPYMQVCVPEKWDDEQVVSFANYENPCGTTNGWHIRKEGGEALAGFHERVPCSEKEGYVHIMLDV